MSKVYCRECEYWDDVPRSFDREWCEGSVKIWGKCMCAKQNRFMRDGHWRKNGEYPPVCHAPTFFHTDLYYGCLDGKKSQLKHNVATTDNVKPLIVDDELPVTDEYDDLPF